MPPKTGAPPPQRRGPKNHPSPPPRDPARSASSNLSDQSLQALHKAHEPPLQLPLRALQSAQPAGDRSIATAPAARTAADSGTATPAPAGLAAAAPALRADLAEDVHRLGVEAARAPLALVRQPPRVQAYVAHQGGIGDARILADLSQREEIAAPARRRRPATSPAARRAPAPAATAARRRRAPTAPAPRRCRGVLAWPPAAPDVLLLDLFEHRQRVLRVTLLAAGAHRWDASLVELFIAL